LKHSASFILVTLTAGLVSLAPPARALTLGDLRGVAIIGRALDVSVRVQAGPAEDLSAACFGAEVFHADARQITPLLTVTPTIAGEALVRVQSAALVDEPVVGLELQSRCGAPTTRRYVLLADIAQPKLPPAAAYSQSALGGTGAVADNVMAAAAPVPPKLVSTSPKAQSKAATVLAEPQLNSPPKPKPAKQAAKAVARSGSRAVLKLDPLEVFSDRIAALDANMLFAPSADALQQARQLTDLQNDVKLLRELSVKNDAQLHDLKAQLQLAQSQQTSPVWLYALGGTALAGLLALAWLLWQQGLAKRAAASAWHDSLPWSADAAAATPVAIKPTAAQSEPTLPAPLAPQPESATPLDAQWYAVAPDELPQPQVAPAKPTTGYPASGLAGLHSFSIEPILDIRQQAEFFVSLGQTDRALHILTQQIADSSEPNPFIYLDLLALLHSLGMKSEFREYRYSFNQHFSAAMPDFAAFHLEGRSLLDYPEVLERLVQGWPSAQTLVLLSAWIFRNPKAATHVPFDLAAFRDLLMLHALAEAVAVDLPWDTAAQPWPADAKTATAPDNAATDPVHAAHLASLAAAAQQLDAPAETGVQTLDMDFSMFDTGTFGLTPSTGTQALAEPPLLPPIDSPRARWPTKDLS